jgi:response regulator RpfG family c-di-GMP phosphodiesterase
MIIDPQVPLHRLVLSLSEAMDHVHASVIDHQQRVAYIATNIARQMGFEGSALLDIFNAAAFHDLGLIGVENKVEAVQLAPFEDIHGHSEAGYILLKNNMLFARAADIIRYHHLPWNHGQG